MESITYSLKCEHSNSEQYYRDVKNFTDEVLLASEESIIPLVEEFIDYLKRFKLETPRAKEEYILELLSFGILWRIYAGTALAVKWAPFITLAKMAEWRKKHRNVKPLIDFYRGIAMSLLLLPKHSNGSIPAPTITNIDKVCKWFEATGEFREEALRFILWRSFWQTKSSIELAKEFSLIRKFAGWFDERSEEVLGKYTKNVNQFLTNTERSYRWREDRISCTKSRLEYHLNMVGADLMNRAFRRKFSETDKKVLLLPGCMRKFQDECKAIRVEEGLICNSCSADCNVNRLKKMGEKKNFEVYIIPHASDLTLWSPKPNRPKLGVVASACVTTLVEGGWELKRYNVPAQCVLLDCSGCKKHWLKEGIPTEFNIRELRRILDQSPV